MSQEKENNFRARIGLLITLTNLENGKGRLSFDDVVNDEMSTESNWVHDKRVMFKDYDLKALNNFEVPQNELAEIGKIILTRAQALNMERVNREELIAEIREAFKDVEFPSHMGIKAAEAVDDWVTDEKELKKLTEKQEFHGPWWKIPESHLSDSSLGLNYLDSTGLAFYLPALMTLALKKPEYKYISPLVSEFNPVHDEEELYLHFCNKFSKITGKRKEACVKFLKFMKEELLLNGHPQIDEVKEIDKALQHEFWKSN